jgi:putative tricarboxylic transport membrane protein
LRNYDFISSLFWFLVGLGFAYGGFYYGFGSWKNPGPGLLPAVFGIILAILSITLMMVALKARMKPGTRRFWREKASWKPILFTILSLIAYMVFLKQVGFILITFLFIFSLLKFIGGKKWLVSILVAFVFSIVCHGLFSSLLKTPLPKGWIYGSSIRHTTRV